MYSVIIFYKCIDVIYDGKRANKANDRKKIYTFNRVI